MTSTAVMHEHLGAGLAVRRLFGVSGLQAAASLGLLLSFGGAAVLLHHDTWLVLFGAMLLPLLIVATGLLALSRWQTLRWEGLWAALAALLAMCGAMAPWLYHFSLNGLTSPTLNDVQVTAVVVAYGLLALALPLWHAQSQARTLHLAKLRQAALIAELKALQAQVEPHFLFNTLANTRYLARHDADKAVQMLDHLIAYLHSALPDMRRAMSNVGRELKLAEHYLALMAIRFGARLSFQIDCADGLADAALPPLMLMSLVENAVRHGVEPKPGPVRIWIVVKQDGADLQISVRDDGAGLNSGTLGNGVGLRNLRLRIEALYGRRASFILLTATDQTTEAKLQLPIAQQERTSDA
jgi:signal transduction histidine kinase